MTVSALIVAGGKATRLGGIDKRTVVVDGETIFARQLAVLAPRVAEILVSARHEVPGYRTVMDAVADAGPLAGIAAGLAAAQTEWLLVVAGDMPHVSATLVEALLAHATADVDAVGVRIGEQVEPLLCVLRVAPARVVVAARLAAQRFAVHRLLTDGALRVAWIPEATLRALDPQLRFVSNVNTPADLPTP